MKAQSTPAVAYYSNTVHHAEASDTFAAFQARLALKFASELVQQQWLTNSENAITAKVEATPSNIVKLKADNLLQLTKSNAIQRLRSIA